MIKLFYLINEPFEGYQTGYRKALLELKQDQIIRDVLFFSGYALEKQLGSWNSVLNKMVDSVLTYKPDIILVAHLSDQPISRKIIDYINRSLPKRPIWIYDERDVYGYIRKPLPKSVLKFAAHCDLVTICTYGNMMNRFKKSGAKRVEFLPHVYDYNFGTEWEPTLERKFDVIMLANLHKSRIPLLSMPGIKEREVLVKIFASKFGERFGIFGSGWDKFPTAQGSVNFFEQEAINRNSWITLGMDHFYKYNGYYSDRLPIALISGVVHITYKTPGLEKIFEDKKDLFFFNTPIEALSIAEQLLKLPKEELIELGLNSKRKFLTSLSEVTRFKKMFNMANNNYESKIEL